MGPVAKAAPRSLTETDDELHVSAELPGVDEMDVEVTLADDTLIIEGEKKTAHEKTKNDCRTIQRSYGGF